MKTLLSAVGTVHFNAIYIICAVPTVLKKKKIIYGGLKSAATRAVGAKRFCVTSVGMWKGAKQGGKPARVAYTIPIKFSLE